MSTFDPREPRILVQPLDLAVMLYNVHQAAKEPDVSYVDCEQRLAGLSRSLDRKPANIRVSQIESALAFCNLMAEAGKFWHPFDVSIDGFIDDVIKRAGRQLGSFSKEYHYFTNVK